MATKQRATGERATAGRRQVDDSRRAAASLSTDSDQVLSWARNLIKERT